MPTIKELDQDFFQKLSFFEAFAKVYDKNPHVSAVIRCKNIIDQQYDNPQTVSQILETLSDIKKPKLSIDTDGRFAQQFIIAHCDIIAHAAESLKENFFIEKLGSIQETVRVFLNFLREAFFPLKNE